ncbi:DUF4267 domain-containing protein [Pinirhizobacter soli]|uniref:DUF4267 domain-containing protein n=1 Tax=Pinirhizobacter soli TaxID=2786953 RepID=UPI0031F3190C
MSPYPSSGLLTEAANHPPGLFVLLLMANGSPRLLGELMLVASLIAFGDMATVLRYAGKKGAALGIHGFTGLVIVATGACLIFGAK